jgi:predicted ArsR family transcriptional regulator
MTNDTMAIDARKKITAYLHHNTVVTAGEISRALKISPADARHHLSALVAAGMAEVTGTRREPGRRGRPVKLYRLSAALRGDNLGLLADEVLGSLAPGQADSVLEAVAGTVAGASIPSGHITRRLSAMIERLNNLHYRARWEAHAAGPQIIFEQCPYEAIIAKHPELCRMDAKALAKLTGAEVEQLAQLEMTERHYPICVFRLI